MINKNLRLLVMTIAAALCLFLPHCSFSGEVGSDFMLDLWKYRTGEEDTGLFTGRPSRKMPDAPASATAIVSGTVDCRKHIALQPNDVIEVQLLDISSRNAAAIAVQKIISARHMPVPFKLTYEPSRINPAHQYTVQARINRNGEPVYYNKAPCFVITHSYSNNARVLVEESDSWRSSQTGPASSLSPSPAHARTHLGTYARSFIDAGGVVDETLHVLNDHTVELCLRYPKGEMKQSGVWSMERNLLAVTVTHKNGEQINPERIVFELKGDCLAAVEYDKAAHGPHFSFNRTGGQE